MAARGCLRPWANVFVAAPTPAIRSPVVILMVITMALVRIVNSTLSWGCKMLEFYIFAPPNADPAQCRPGRMPPPPSLPLPAATAHRVLVYDHAHTETCIS